VARGADFRNVRALVNLHTARFASQEVSLQRIETLLTRNRLNSGLVGSRISGKWMLAAALLIGGGCCAPLQHTPSHCGCAVSEQDLGCALDRICKREPLTGCGLAVESECVAECTDCKKLGSHCVSCRHAISGICHKCRNWSPGCNVEPGPPPITYRPPMPPEFLPLPTYPIFAAVNLAAPEPLRGAVEVDYGPQLTVPGKN